MAFVCLSRPRQRLAALAEVLVQCPEVRHVVVVDGPPAAEPPAHLVVHRWAELLDAGRRASHRIVDQDIAAILYTSGSTGKPKGVVLSHRNMVAGAKSVASYLENRQQ